MTEQRTPMPQPALPAMMWDADGKIPAWAGQDEDEPFEVRQFLESRAAPPDNAAPMYFAALADVSVEMYAHANAPAWWPWRSPVPDGVRERCRRINELADSEKLRANGFPMVEIESVLEMARPALEKLDQAQQKPQCVFISGTRVDSLLSFAQASRTFARLTGAQLYHARMRGDFQGAEQAICRTLRLARDLRPRGFAVSQLVSFALDHLVLAAVSDFTITQEGFGTRECDRLLAILAEHQRDALPPLEEAFRVEYIMVRTMLDDFQVGRQSAESLAQALHGPGVEASALAARLNGVDFPKEISACNRYFAAALAVAGRPLHELLAMKPLDPEEDKLNAEGSILMAALMPCFDALLLAAARHGAMVAGMECLVAVRRYVLVHGAPPADLETATREAGLPAIPVDPISGQPMRYQSLRGRPAVSSIGYRIDESRDSGIAETLTVQASSGDILYRMRG